MGGLSLTAGLNLGGNEELLKICLRMSDVFIVCRRLLAFFLASFCMPRFGSIELGIKL